MEMTNEEILRSYKNAKDRSAQISILAQLNATTEDRIREIINANKDKVKNEAPIVKIKVQSDRKTRTDITEETREKIAKEILEAKENTAEIARKYNISYSLACKIKKNYNCKTVDKDKEVCNKSNKCETSYKNKETIGEIESSIKEIEKSYDEQIKRLKDKYNEIEKAIKVLEDIKAKTRSLIGGKNGEV